MEKLLLSIVLFAAMSNVALAAANTASSNTGGAPFKRSYLNLQLGFGGILSGTSTLPDSVTAYGIGSKASVGDVSYRFSGGYLFNIMPRLQLGPELGYNGYGDSYYSIATDGSNYTKIVQYSGYTFDLLANSIYHFNRKWSIGAKLGLAAINQTLKANNDKFSKNKVLPEVGINGYYEFSHQLGLNFGILTTLGGSTPDPLANATTEQISPDEVAVKIPVDPNEVANVGSLFIGLDFEF